jgi:hypothetical protein
LTPHDFNLTALSVFLSIASIVVVLASNASGPGLLVGVIAAAASVVVCPSPP